MMGRHFLVSSKRHPKIKRHYTICSSMRLELRDALEEWDEDLQTRQQLHQLAVLEAGFHVLAVALAVALACGHTTREDATCCTSASPWVPASATIIESLFIGCVSWLSLTFPHILVAKCSRSRLAVTMCAAIFACNLLSIG